MSLAIQINPLEVIGDPPDWFDADQKAVWAEIARLTPPGTLHKAAGLWMELTAWLVDRLRKTGLDEAESALLKQFLGEMPMLTADAQKLMVRERTPESDALATLAAFHAERIN